MIAIEESSILPFDRKNNHEALYRLLSELHKLECLHPGQYIDDIHSNKAQLKALYTEEYMGALVRARALRFSEQPCSTSLRDERQHALSKEILEIEYGGIVVNEPTLITKAFFEHYAKRFRSHEPLGKGASAKKCISFLPQLSLDDCDYTNANFDISEIAACIDS